MEQQMETRPVPGKQIRDGRLAKVRDAPSIELQYSFPQNGYAAMIATLFSLSFPKRKGKHKSTNKGKTKGKNKGKTKVKTKGKQR